VDLLQDVAARAWGFRPSFSRLGAPLLERALGLEEATRLYEAAQSRDEALFSDRALGALGIDVDIEGDLERIPTAGPLVVVANHPFGAVDGLLMASIAGRRRPDVRCLANRVLERLPEARREMFLVDITGGAAAAARNHRPLRAAMSWVRHGGCLGVFPAGIVAHAAPLRWRAQEAPWHASIARLIRATGAAVVPFFIEGGNSWLFQAAGMIHPAMRSALLVRELLKLRGRTLRVHVGTPLAPDQLPRGIDALADELRERTVRLGATTHRRTIPRPAVATTLRDEVRRLSSTQLLASADDYRAFWANAAQAPRLVRAIGAAREETFRMVGEGTGGDVDLDEFDRDYVHLCVWDNAADELVGAYRLKYLDGAGAQARLYTKTLFRFGAELERALSPGVELGRAFVRAPYQKQYAPLMLLWSGIGRYVTTRTDARYLFGPVSISAQYSPAARDLMVGYLSQYACDSARSRHVEARRPVACAAGAGAPASLDELMARLTEIDPSRGVPVLLRQYLKLGARALAFSVDPGFGHTIDALMVVDLHGVPERMRKRYLTPRAANTLEPEPHLTDHDRSHRTLHCR
jgi:putative hemolysin